MTRAVGTPSAANSKKIVVNFPIPMFEKLADMAFAREIGVSQLVRELCKKGFKMTDHEKTELHKIMRTAEMSAAVMRDPARTGGWIGAERVARAFESLGQRLKELIS